MKISRLLPLLLLLSLIAVAQEVPSVLRPPKGSPVGLVVFEDLQCPQCARAAPQLVQASQTYKIPLVQRDFPLPMHNWSMNAAILARYFDTLSKGTGDAFRLYIFEHQREILVLDRLEREANVTGDLVQCLDEELWLARRVLCVPLL